MFEFEWLWLLLLLPLPVLSNWRARQQDKQQEAALRVPFLDDFAQTDGGNVHSIKHFIQALLPWLAWACLIAAAAKPIWMLRVNRTVRIINS